MIIKYKPTYMHELPVRWIFKDYYRVTDEKLFFLKVIEYGVVFEKVEDSDYELMIYRDLPP